MSDRMKSQPPVVVWWCPHKPPRKSLQVFLTRNGWRVEGSQMVLPEAEYGSRIDSLENDLGKGDLRRGVAMGRGRVTGIRAMLPFDYERWPSGSIEVGCTCRPTASIDAPIEWLIEDCRHAQQDRTRVERNIGYS